jgi:hypothetical protein
MLAVLNRPVLNRSVLNHRASAYHELDAARTKLMGLKQTRTGLFIKKGHGSFSCHRILRLLADIATATFDELRLMMNVDWFEKKLCDDTHHQNQRRIWLGSNTPELHHPQPRRHKMDALTAYLMANLVLRNLHKPRI